MRLFLHISNILFEYVMLPSIDKNERKYNFKFEDCVNIYTMKNERRLVEKRRRHISIVNKRK